MLQGGLLRRLLPATIALIVVAGGATLAVAGGYGGSHGGNAGHDQYNPKPGCGPHKSDGWAGGSGWHYGQPPKDHNRGDCPRPRRDDCDDDRHRFSAFTTGSHHNDCDDDCRRHSAYFTGGGGSYGGHGIDCDDHVGRDACNKSSKKKTGSNSKKKSGEKDGCKKSSSPASAAFAPQASFV